MKFYKYPDRHEKWHKWFAWHPVWIIRRLDANTHERIKIWIWFEKIQRRWDSGQWVYMFIGEEYKK
jgi:hypothetical protein